jgi:hypothetical protein
MQLWSRPSDFLRARKQISQPITDDDGPFTYRYKAVYKVVGAKLPEECGAPLGIAGFPDLNASAYLTEDWEHEFEHLDRRKAVAALLLKRFFHGAPKSRLHRHYLRLKDWLLGPMLVFEGNLERQLAEVRQNRRNSHSGSGSALVYSASGELPSPPVFRSAKKISGVGVCIGGVDGDAIRAIHDDAQRGVATALSLALSETSGTPDVRFLEDGIHLCGDSGVVVYPLKLTGHAAAVAVTTLPSADILQTVAERSYKLGGSRTFTTIATMFALSQQVSNDNLRSFIAGWSALEKLIWHQEKSLRDEFHLLVSDEEVTLPKWDRDLADVPLEDYRLRDRFYVTACVLNPGDSEADINKFVTLNGKRNDYYHDFSIADTDLPTHDVQSLFRKYFKLALARI